MFYTIQVTLEDKSTYEMQENERFLQSVFWSQFKSVNGWNPKYFSVRATRNKVSITAKDNEAFTFKCTVLVRRFSKFVSIAYIPMGLDIFPSVDDKGNTVFPIISDQEYLLLLSETASELKKSLPKDILCVRYDTPDEFSECDERDEYINKIVKGANAKREGLVKSPVDIQPPDTTVLDLTLSEDEILKNMKSKCRYNIKVAQKNNVTIRIGSVDDVPIFFNLYEETSKRDGIAIHAKEYFTKLLTLSNDVNNSSNKTSVWSESSELSASENKNRCMTPVVRLYIAEHEGEPLAAIIVLFTPFEAVYLFGASSNNKRNFMPAYLLQWTAIQDAKKYGSTHYDFYGMPPTDDEHHPMHGLYRFKTGFGGAIVHRAGSIDVPCSILYMLYIAAEKMRAFAYKRLKKLFAGR